jgi:dihydroneopterin aldolase
MRTVSIEGLRVQASVGILEHELRSKQVLSISMTVDLPDVPALPQEDDVHHVLDYRQLREIAKREAESSGHINMLETLAGRIAKRLLQLKGVSAVKVKVDKPHIFPDCDTVWVEVRDVKS